MINRPPQPVLEMNDVNPPPPAWLTYFRRHRYSVLLAAIVILLITSPILREVRPSTGTGLAEIGLTIVFVVLLLCAIPIVGQNRSTIIIAALLSGITIVLYVVTHFSDEFWITITQQIFTSAFQTMSR